GRGGAPGAGGAARGGRGGGGRRRRAGGGERSGLRARSGGRGGRADGPRGLPRELRGEAARAARGGSRGGRGGDAAEPGRGWRACARPRARLSIPSARRERRGELVVQPAVRREALAPGRRGGPAAQVAGAPAGLLDDEQPGRDVPGVELQLPEAVEASRGDVAEVERGAAVAAHRAGALHQRGEVVEIVLVAAAHVVGEAGRDERLGERARLRDA